jgi:hypothetical protein
VRNAHKNSKNQPSKRQRNSKFQNSPERGSLSRSTVKCTIDFGLPWRASPQSSDTNGVVAISPGLARFGEGLPWERADKFILTFEQSEASTASFITPHCIISCTL